MPTPSRGHATPDWHGAPEGQGAPAEGPYVESRKLGMLADAEAPGDALRAMRGAIEELLGALGVGERVRIERAERGAEWAEPAALVVEAADAGRVVGAYGVATAEVVKRFDLQAPVVLAELDYEWLIAGYPPMPRIEPLARYPAIERDVSVVVEEAVAWAVIEAEVREARPVLLEGVAFVTTYRGKPVEKGRKSVTFRMTFRDPSRTLGHEEVSEQVEAVVGRLRERLGAELRAT